MIVPTRVIPQQPSDERRERALVPWRLGEELKCGLQNAPHVLLPKMEQGTNALSRALLAGDAAQVQALQQELEKVRIHRWEMDALVIRAVERSIANCNALIRSELGEEKCDPPEEVHWVVASGNALRCQLLQDMLKHRLDVPFLLDGPIPLDPKNPKLAPKPSAGMPTGSIGRFTFDPENAKVATAKGAVLALATLQSRGEIRIEFDSDLSNRLPYDVAYRDLSVNQDAWLYHEHTHYRELKAMNPIEVSMAALRVQDRATAVSASAPKQFELSRRFPGDEGFSKFMLIEFPEGIQGDLKVSYDDESPFEFTVVDSQGNVGQPRDLTNDSVYRAPAQRGDI
jgi:hypothetical protein